jgi:hypothetical protein
MSLDETETTKVIEDYGVVMEELFSGCGPLCIYDERRLPHPKSVIRNSLYLKLREYPYDRWERIEGGKEIYNSLLSGLYSLVMFQRDLGDWQIVIPDQDEELIQLGQINARSLINHIDSILHEIGETSEKMDRLKIKRDPEGQAEPPNLTLLLLLRLAKQKLRDTFKELADWGHSVKEICLPLVSTPHCTWRRNVAGEFFRWADILNGVAAFEGRP